MGYVIAFVAGAAVGYWHIEIEDWISGTAWPWIRAKIFRRPA